MNNQNKNVSTDQLLKEVNVYVSGGVVQSVDSPKGITVNIFDYDIDGCDKSELSKDPTGDLCNHYQF